MKNKNITKEKKQQEITETCRLFSKAVAGDLVGISYDIEIYYEELIGDYVLEIDIKKVMRKNKEIFK